MRHTHVENLSQSDKTNISNAMFMNNTNLVGCQSSYVLPPLSLFVRFCWKLEFFEFFGLEVVMSFSRKYSRWGPITLNTL